MVMSVLGTLWAHRVSCIWRCTNA